MMALHMAKEPPTGGASVSISVPFLSICWHHISLDADVSWDPGRDYLCPGYILAQTSLKSVLGIRALIMT